MSLGYDVIGFRIIVPGLDPLPGQSLPIAEPEPDAGRPRWWHRLEGALSDAGITLQGTDTKDTGGHG